MWFWCDLTVAADAMFEVKCGLKREDCVGGSIVEPPTTTAPIDVTTPTPGPDETTTTVQPPSPSPTPDYDDEDEMNWRKYL